MSLSTLTVIEEYHASKTFRQKIDGLFALAAAHIEGFAASHALELHRWYHDAPIWILSLEEQGIVRNIHVGPTSDERKRKLGLGIAVDAYEAGGPPAQRKSLRGGRAIGHVSKAELQEDAGLFMDLLERAYRRAKQVAKEDLV